MSPKKNKLGVKNSLVNNINAKKKAGTSRPKDDSTISRKAYEKMQDNWGKKRKKPAKKAAKKTAKKVASQATKATTKKKARKTTKRTAKRSPKKSA